MNSNIKYIGVNDKSLDLFEGQYLIPNGISYNSYVITDEKTAIMDTADARVMVQWAESLEKALEGRAPDYLIISHMEPDHAGSIAMAVQKYPDMQIVGNAKTFGLIKQFFGLDLTGRTITVKDGDQLCLGKRTLRFFTAPMVHWPEVMVTYDSYGKLLFSADGFGKFGALGTDEDWTCEARRYYFNILGKYGAQVQALLKKLEGFEISAVYPLHGPVLENNLSYYIDKYKLWSSYMPEDEGVFIAYASIYGHTAQAARLLADMLKEKGIKTVVSDLARADIAECVEDAFRYDRMVLACSTYDGGLFPPMETFLQHLKSKTYRNRRVGIMENGSWGPCAAKYIKEALGQMKDITALEPVITIKSEADQTVMDNIKTLADVLADSNQRSDADNPAEI